MGTAFYVYETEEGTLVMDLVYPEGIACVSGSSDSDYYAFGTDEGSVAVIDTSSMGGNIEWQKNIGNDIS